MHERQPAPVPDAQRIALLDVLRGFAVLGILLANVPFMAMAAPLVEPFGLHIGDTWLDRASHHFVFLFADTKFITLFSTLFGAGLALMSEKARTMGTPFVGRYLRRLLALAIFGAAHVALLWFGDILLIYALIGFVAIWFRNCRVKTLMIWALILLLLNGVLWGLGGLVEPSEMVGLATDANGQTLSLEATLAKQAAEYRQIFAGGGFGEMMAARFELYMGSGVFLLVLMGMRTLALFLIGMAVIKSGALTRFAVHRKGLFRAIGLGLGIGMALEVLALIGSYDMARVSARLTFTLGLYFGGLLMALAYAAMFSLWMHTNFCNGLRMRFAYVGRMALSNYICHSVITAVIFNYLGQFDQWRRPWLLLLVFAIYGLQMWWSPIWLRHYRFGPLEWVWRVLTYGRLVPMRRR